VVFEVDVLPSGEVASVRIISGPEEFYDTVIKTVKKRWRFEPATFGGKPVRFRKKMSLVFRLSDYR
jgi:outer membrane biosynthesis protein TonB